MLVGPSEDGEVIATNGDLALVVTDAGLGGVGVGSSTARWEWSDGVAAPDASAAFGLESDPPSGTASVVRIDPTDGRRTPVGSLPAMPGLRVAAVSPEGRRVVLTSPGPRGDSTTVVVFDPAIGAAVLQRSFEGVLEPEALSLDGRLLFAARIYGDRYHVHVLDLTTGEQYPTLGPDKTGPPEDMYGSVVQAALSPDGRQLATLYRDGSTPSHTAFVHLLALDNGTTVCIDLHAPFGTSDDLGADAIAWQDAQSIAVGHVGRAGVTAVATFSPATIWSQPPQPHYHADVVEGPAPPALPSRVTRTPGFRRFIGVVKT